MRKHQSVIKAFANRQPSRTVNNTCSDGTRLTYHGNTIAEWRGSILWITNAGWATPTTKERLNMLPDVRVHQVDFEWLLNGKPWGGEWTAVIADPFRKAVAEIA